ncbi:hypothetical protein CGRA01v4_04025 [Colletotrichum graminicola]|nr:hypothetical protein CGRA01v4_04025 [Colletotrichum graminicola]
MDGRRPNPHLSLPNQTQRLAKPAISYRLRLHTYYHVAPADSAPDAHRNLHSINSTHTHICTSPTYRSACLWYGRGEGRQLEISIGGGGFSVQHCSTLLPVIMEYMHVMRGASPVEMG